MTVKSKSLNKKEALAKTQNYVIIEFGYDKNYVFPYKDGIAIMTALETAERYNAAYGDDIKKIMPIDFENTPNMRPLSVEDYLEFKMNTLLNVDTGKQNE